MRSLFFLQMMAAFSLTATAQIYSGPSAFKYHPYATRVWMDDRANAPLYIAFRDDSFVSSMSGMEPLRSVLKCGKEDSWQLHRSDIDELGVSHMRFRQYYRDIRVITGEYIIHSRNNHILSANGIFHDIGDMDVIPSLSETEALAAAIELLAARKYLWQAGFDEQRILYGGDAFPDGELVILPSPVHKGTRQASLCWSFDIYAVDPHLRRQVYVDAHNGNLVFSEDKICSVNVNATALTRYSGTQVMQVDSFGQPIFRLRDESRGNGVQTFNLMNGTSYSNAVDFTDTDNFWSSTANQDDAAYDAHWGAQRSYDYFHTVHNRNSFDNAGAVIRSYVHYGNSFNNAFWNGSVMTYGDGDGYAFSPLTELDIVAHEITHGVTAFSSGLIYSHESGALNESFSDIFGVTVDFFVRPAQGSFTIGDQSYTPHAIGDGLRYMHHPNAAADPDTYQGLYWYTGAADNGGVHINSGVQNFWYYLLCQGGSGINDHGFAYSVAGIGMDKARMIAYRNNSYYLTPSSQYADAAFYSLLAANDLYGNCSPEAMAVKNAWDAVGLYGLSLNSNASAFIVGPPCVGGELNLSAGGGISFAWSGPAGFTSTLQHPSISNAGACNNGTYRCVVTDAGGCSGIAELKVELSPAPLVTVAGSFSLCRGDSLQLITQATIPGAGNNIGISAIPVNIPDNNPSGVTSFISINQNYNTRASDVISVTIDSLSHSWVSDLRIELIAPDGSVILLANRAGGPGDHFIRTRFQATGTAIAGGSAPFTGNYTPQESFSLLSGSAAGTWGLRVKDLNGQDTGTLWKWSIELSGINISSYCWTPATGLSTSNIPDPVCHILSTTAYTVTVSTSEGCTGTATTTVPVVELVSNVQKNNETCPGKADGSALILLKDTSTSHAFLWSNGATTAFVSGLNAGSYTFTVTGPSGCSETGSFIINSNTVPTSPGPITGPSTGVCSGSVQTYSIIPVPGATGYTWDFPAGAVLISGQGTDSIKVTFPGNFTSGNITVSAYNACGSGNAVSLSVRSLPVPQSSINGAVSSVCNSSATYTTPVSLTGATSYNWTTSSGSQILNGQGTTGIQVIWPATSLSNGNVCVISNNLCGSSSPRCLSNITTLPFRPPIINGPAQVCRNQPGVTYSVAVQPGVTYNWSVPAGAIITAGQGTSSIVVRFGTRSGNISVRASNACGTTSSTNLKVNFNCRQGSDDQDDIYLHPNPSSGLFHIRFENAVGSYLLTVYDLTGRMIRREEASRQEYELDMTSQPRGIYLVSVELADGYRKVLRAIRAD